MSFSSNVPHQRHRASLSFWLSAILVLSLLSGGSVLAAVNPPEAGAADLPEATQLPDATPPADEPHPTADAKAASDRQLRAEEVIYDRVSVVGSLDSAVRLPGAASTITLENLEEQQYFDIHRILRQIPGINIQEEEGYGLRPNIGIRGTGVERSQKITLMEDGVLIAPAPYTAPAAYYFPTAGRMENVEIRKGSAAIRQGPYTNGGAINLVSSSIPDQLGAKIDVAAGTESTLRIHARLGASAERIGWSLEGYRFETDGFKDLDNGDGTGVGLDDYVGKLRVSSRSDASTYQALELKLGKTRQDGDETYLGLTEADFRATPFRRYAGSAEDHIDTDHEQVQLRHFLQLTPNLDVTTTVYNNDFFRDWFKNENTRGVSNANVLASPELYPEEIAILRGEADSAPGELRLRHNRRSYYSRGFQSTVGLHLSQRDSVNHDIEFGLRYHEDEEDRFQEEDLYQMVGGSIVLTGLGQPGSQTNRVSSAEALAVFVQDEITFGRWAVTPGVRFEAIDYVREDYSRSDPTRSLGPTRVRENDVTAVLPGIGVSYSLTDAQHLFLGIHRGFSPPGAGRNEDTREEESTNYELGWRYKTRNLGFELIGFFNDYSNLLGAETVAGGGDTTGELFNGGEVRVQGLELAMNTDLGRGLAGSLSVPVRLAYTLTQAEFRSSFETGFADWAPEVQAGDELPYLPEHQLSLSVGLSGKRWGLHANASYVDEMRTRAGQGPIPAREGTDSRVIVDLSADFEVLSRLGVFAQVRNLLDEQYIVARRPYGIRPGLPSTFLAGIKARF